MIEIYLIQRLDGIWKLCLAAVIILGMFIGAALLCWCVYDDEKSRRKIWRVFIKLIPATAISVLGLIFIPTTRQAYAIIGIGGTIEYLKANDTARKLPEKAIIALDKWLNSEISKDKEKKEEKGGNQ